jgi:hypothetical protein
MLFATLTDFDSDSHLTSLTHVIVQATLTHRKTPTRAARQTGRRSAESTSPQTQFALPRHRPKRRESGCLRLVDINKDVGSIQDRSNRFRAASFQTVRLAIECHHAIQVLFQKATVFESRRRIAQE